MRLHVLTDHHPDIVPMGDITIPCKLRAIDNLVAKYVDPSRAAPCCDRPLRLTREWVEYMTEYFAGKADEALFHASFMAAE